MDLKLPSEVLFYNSEYIVVEYIDMIKAPYLLLADRMRKYNAGLKQIIDLDQISTLSIEGLYEWYMMRKHRNFLIDLCKYPDKIGTKYLDKLLSDHLNSDYRFYQYSNLLPIGNMLIRAKAHDLVKGMIVFSEDDPKGYIEKDLKDSYDIEITYMTNFDDVMKLAKNDSTYFLSDIKKIDRMKEADVLKYSSVTLPVEYRYNKKDSNHYDIDFDKLWETDPFKLSYVRTITLNPK